MCIDSEHVRAILPKVSKPYATYGLDDTADIYATDIENIGAQMKFTVHVQMKGHEQEPFEVVLNMPGRHNGVLISQEQGEAVAYALWNLEDRGRMFVSPNDKVYEGMIIGIHSRDNDLVVNPLKGKKLTNVRASGTDEAVRLTTPIKLTLEGAVEFIDDDELVEITPQSIRLRKRYLSELERRRHFKKLDLILFD